MRLPKLALLSLFIILISFSLTTAQKNNGIKSKVLITRAAKAAVPHISVVDLKAKINKGHKFYLIDVRSVPEYLAGHIQGAINIPRGLMEFKIAKMIPNPNAEIVVYCKASSRGSLTAKAMIDMGYKNVKDMMGGIKAWIKAKYPFYNNLLGKIRVVDFKAKEVRPHGNGLVNKLIN